MVILQLMVRGFHTHNNYVLSLSAKYQEIEKKECKFLSKFQFSQDLDLLDFVTMRFQFSLNLDLVLRN